MSTLIVTGGNLETGSCQAWLTKQPFDHVIAVDGGLLHAEKMGLSPDYIVGDFDTLPPGRLEKYKERPEVTIRAFQPEKDDTDTQIAVELALQLEGTKKAGSGVSSGFQVVLAGAIGSRLDHTLANVFLLEKFEKAGILACCMDEHNRISVHSTGFFLKKEQQYGKYVSFLALTPQVTGMTLTGFRYPLADRTLQQEDSLCISNEITGEIAAIEFREGRLLMIEARD